MRHNLKIRVSRDTQNGGVIACRKVSIREKLLTKLFGPQRMITVLVPGDSVDTIAISDANEEGGVQNE